MGSKKKQRRQLAVYMTPEREKLLRELKRRHPFVSYSAAIFYAIEDYLEWCRKIDGEPESA